MKALRLIQAMILALILTPNRKQRWKRSLSRKEKELLKYHQPRQLQKVSKHPPKSSHQQRRQLLRRKLATTQKKATLTGSHYLKLAIHPAIQTQIWCLQRLTAIQTA